MKNKLIFLVLIGLMGIVSAGITPSPTSISISQYESTSNVHNFTVTNNGNTTESLKISLIGSSELQSWFLGIEQTASIQSNSTQSIYFIVNLPTSTTNKSNSGLIMLNYSSQTTIPITINLQTTSTTTTTTTSTSTTTTTSSPTTTVSTTTTLSTTSTTTSSTTTTIPTSKSVSVQIFGKIKPNSRTYFIISDNSTLEPVQSGVMLVDTGLIKEVPINSNGYTLYEAPSAITCPAMLIISVPGYSTKTMMLGETYCQSSETTTTTSRIRFLTSRYYNSYEQWLTVTESFWLKNYGNCPADLLSADLLGTIMTSDGRKPIRLGTASFGILPPGEKTEISAIIDTNNIDMGIYKPSLKIVAEDCLGYVETTLSFEINVIKGIRPIENTTTVEPQLDISISGANTIGSTSTIRITSNGTIIPNANIKVTFPDNTIARYTTSLSGEVSFMITQTGDYKLDADKTGYKPISSNFSIGKKALDIKTNTVYLYDVLDITISADGIPVSGVTLEVTTPDNIPKTYTTTSSGLISLNVNQEGNYIIKASKIGYDSETKTISVILRGINITLSDNPFVDSPVTITLTSGGSSISDASVVIKSPTGNESRYSYSGNMIFMPKEYGDYVLSANKTGYSTKSIVLSLIKKELRIETSGNLLVGSSLLITTLDGVNIDITDPDGTITSQTIPSSGRISITLEQGGKYNISASKTGYVSHSVLIDAKKKTMTLTPTYYNSLGGIASIPTYNGKVTATLSDPEKQLSPDYIKIKYPDGTIREIGAILDLEGAYSIIAKKENYQDANIDFSITIPLTIIIPPKNLYTIGESVYARFNKPTTTSIDCVGSSTPLTTTDTGELNYTASTEGICYLKYGNDKFQFEVKPQNLLSNITITIAWIVGILLVFAIIIFTVVRYKGHKSKSTNDMGDELEAYHKSI